MADQYYIVEGYLADDYFVYVAEAEANLSTSCTISCSGDIADTTGYYIPDYIAEGYFESGTTQEASASLTVTATTTAVALRIRPGESDLAASATQTTVGGRVHSSASVSITGAFTPSLTVFATRAGDVDLVANFALASSANRTRSTDVTLSNIVNLSLQGDRTRPGSSSISSAATVSSTPERIRTSGVSLSSAFSATITAGELSEGASLSAGTFSLTANGGYLLEADSTLNSAFTQPDTYAIKYVLRNNPYDRPINLDATHGNFAFNINTKIEGTHSMSITPNATARTTESSFFELGANGEFYLDFYWRYSSHNANITPPIVSYGYDSTEDIDSMSGVSFQIGFPTLDSSRRPTQIRARIARPGTTDIVLNDSISSHGGGATYLKENQWYRIVLRREYRASLSTYSTLLSVYEGTNTSSIAGDIANGHTQALVTPSDPRLYFISNSSTSLFDYLRFNRGEGNLWSTTSGTPYILDFNNEGVDELWFVTHEGAADLDSAVTVTADPSFVYDVSSTLASDFDATTTGNYTVGTSSNLSSTAAISAEPTRIKQLDAALNAIFSQTAVLDRLRLGASSLTTVVTQNATSTKTTDTDSSLSSSFTQNSEILRIRSGEISLSALNSTVTVVNKIGNTLVSIDTAFTQTVDPVKTTDTDADLDLTVTLSSDAVRTRSFDSALSSSFGVTTLNQRIRTTDIESYLEDDYIDSGYFLGGIQTTATILATPGSVEQGSATISSSTTVTADVGKIVQGSTSLASTSTSSTTADRTRSTRVAINSAFAPTVIAVATRVGETSLAVAFTQTASGDRTRTTGAAITGAFTPSIAVNAQLLGEITIGAEFAISIDPTKIFATRVDAESEFNATTSAEFTASGSATLDATASVTEFIGGARFEASAAIEGVFGVTADTKIIHVDQQVFNIHTESRVYTVPRESRLYSIHSETRTTTVEPEDRLGDVHLEQRLTTIEG